ncbi:hypothetical protein BDV18DRAFT_142914 [Aspergillus unguis]
MSPIKSMMPATTRVDRASQGSATPIAQTPPSYIIDQRCLHRVRRSNKVVCRTHISLSLHPVPSSP